MTPTTQDVLALLPIVADGQWYEGAAFRTIRHRTTGRCPVCALAHAVDPVAAHLNARQVNHAGAAEVLGVLPYVTKRIADAADDPDHPLRPALMQALMIPTTRCGLR